MSFPGGFVTVTQNVALAYVALMLTLAVSSALAAGNEVCETCPISRDRPLKGIVQVLQIAVFIAASFWSPI